jgi:ABC-type Fe3+ transport system permease subunit
VFGSIGVAQIASALSDGPRPDPNLDAMFLLLFLTTAFGAVGGGILASMVRRKFAYNKRRLDQLALLPFLAAAVLVGYATFSS